MRLLLVVGLLALSRGGSSLPWPFARTVCSTPECVDAAERIKLYMDPKKDKCQNFYQFACGNFPKHATIPKDEVEISSTTELETKVFSQLKVILSEEPKTGDLRPFTYVRDLYKLCMDEKSINAQGVLPAMSLLRVAGGWPLMEAQWDSAAWGVTRVMMMLWSLGAQYNSVLDVELTDSYLKIDQPKLGLPMHHLRKGITDYDVVLYFEYMRDVVRLFGVEGTDVDDKLKQIVQFEIQIAQIMTPAEERNNLELSRRYSTEYLATLDTWLDWQLMMKTMSPPEATRAVSVFRVYDKPYFDKLKELLSRTDTKTVVNYMMWRAADGLVPLLTADLRDRRFQFSKQLSLDTTLESRWRQCVRVAGNLKYALSTLYVQSYIGDTDRQAVTNIAKSLRKEVMMGFSKLDWMDEPTREKAESKAKSVDINFEYSILDRLKFNKLTKLEEHYAELQMDNQRFFEAVLDIEKWRRSRVTRLQRDGRPVDEGDVEDVTKVKAFYEAHTNSLHLAPNIMQPPFFSTNLPDYLDYATVGYTIAREITHAFDDKGSRFNERGGDVFDWWTVWTRNKFISNRRCYRNQYNAFIESSGHTDLQVDVDRTVEENMSDHGGLELSYRAYKRLSRQSRPELPGLGEFTTDQLFLLARANLQCALALPEVAQYRMQSGVYAPAEFRVNSPIMNLPEFGAIFGCDQKTPMNPETKCRVW